MCSWRIRASAPRTFGGLADAESPDRIPHPTAGRQDPTGHRGRLRPQARTWISGVDFSGDASDDQHARSAARTRVEIQRGGRAVNGACKATRLKSVADEDTVYGGTVYEGCKRSEIEWYAKEGRRVRGASVGDDGDGDVCGRQTLEG